jgi:hypothetical protein
MEERRRKEEVEEERKRKEEIEIRRKEAEGGTRKRIEATRTGFEGTRIRRKKSCQGARTGATDGAGECK